MTNLPHLWFLHSLPHPLPKGRALCVSVRAVFLVYCVGLGFFILNFIIRMLLCIYNKDIHGFISISGFATCILLSVTCIPCPSSLFRNTLHCYSSIHLKDTQQVAAKYKKDQLSQGKSMERWEKGLINYAGHVFMAAERSCVL